MEKWDADAQFRLEKQNEETLVRSGVSNLGYMYRTPRGTFKVSNRRENVFAYYLFPNMYTHISDYYFQKTY